eukprot:8444448-Ditylum_brightwellii.AAC.1
MSIFFKNYHHQFLLPKPFMNKVHNANFGAKVAKHTKHPDINSSLQNCIEGNVVGYKTPESNSFCSHIDYLNLWRDPSYAFTIVMPEVVPIPPIQVYHLVEIETTFLLASSTTDLDVNLHAS